MARFTALTDQPQLRGLTIPAADVASKVCEPSVRVAMVAAAGDGKYVVNRPFPSFDYSPADAAKAFITPSQGNHANRLGAGAPQECSALVNILPVLFTVRDVPRARARAYPLRVLCAVLEMALGLLCSALLAVFRAASAQRITVRFSVASFVGAGFLGIRSLPIGHTLNDHFAVRRVTFGGSGADTLGIRRIVGAASSLGLLRVGLPVCSDLRRLTLPAPGTEAGAISRVGTKTFGELRLATPWAFLINGHTESLNDSLAMGRGVSAFRPFHSTAAGGS